MREIKFRYWCNIENKMYDKAYVEEHLKLAFLSELIEAAQQRYTFLQYTGLKDKNGKEIYEKDKLKCRTQIIKTMEWIESEEVIEDIRQVYDFLNYDELEVIGNVYEDGELNV